MSGLTRFVKSGSRGRVVFQVRMRASRAATSVQSTFVSSLPARGKRSPIKLSAIVPRNAAVAMRSAESGAASMPTARASAEVSPAAATPARVPGREIAPSVPDGTFLRVVIRRGVRLKSWPISDSAVSAKAAPMEATKAAVRGSEPGAAASAVFLGGSGALLSTVAEPGQEGAPDHEQGEDGEAACSEGGIDRGPDEEPAQGAAAADHTERVGEGGEGPGYQEGGRELGGQVVLRAPEPLEEATGVALALRRDGVQQGRFDHAGLHACPRQTLDALVEEGARQRTRLLRDGDNHTVEVPYARITDRAYGVDGVGAILADGEDVHGSNFRRVPVLPQALPERRSLRKPGFQRGPGESRPDVTGHPAGERALVIYEHADRGFRHAKDVSRTECYPSPTSRFCSRRKKTSISFTVWRSPFSRATSLPLSKTLLAWASSWSS